MRKKYCLHGMKKICQKKKTLLCFTCLCLISFSFLSARSFAQAAVEMEPKTLDLSIKNEDLQKEIILTNYVISNINMSDAKIIVTDLYETEKRHLPIASSRIVITPQHLDLVEGTPQEIKIQINLSDTLPGKYAGKILVLGNPSIKSEFPVNIAISVSDTMILIPLIFGVAANFTLKYTKRMMEIKNTLDKEFEDFISSTLRKVMDSGKNNKFLSRAADFWYSALALREDGKYEEARTHLNFAKEDFEEGLSAKNDPSTTLSQIPFAPLSPVGIKSLVKSIPRMRDAWVFIGLTITLGISVITIWQNFSSQTSTFGASGLDYITAFLFSFASQALLGEALDLAIKK